MTTTKNKVRGTRATGATGAAGEATGAKIIRFGKTKAIRRAKEMPAEALLLRYLAAVRAGRIAYLGIVATTVDGYIEEGCWRVGE